MSFQKAVKKAAKGRISLSGPPGSGKTYTSLEIARHMCPGGTILVVDTERGSASKYADEFDFFVEELESYSPDALTKLIKQADAEGINVLIIDSLSHFWMGTDGMLDQVSKQAKRKNYGSDFAAWKDVSPQEKEMWNTLLGTKCHVIATMRTKTEYVMEEVTGRDGKTRTVPKKVGLAPVQRQGTEYEFDIVAELDVDQNFVVTKSRCKPLTSYVTHNAGREFALQYRAWLDGGAIPAEEPKAAAKPTNGNGAAKPAPADPDADERKKLWARLVEVAGDKTAAAASLKARGYNSLNATPLDALRDLIRELEMPSAAPEDDVPFDIDPAPEAAPEPAPAATAGVDW
jgi:hypothetical protein